MKSISAAWAAAGLAAALLGGVSSAADTASESASEPSDAGIPIERIIATVAHKTGKKYLIDPRVHAHVQLVGQDPSNITYSDLLNDSAGVRIRGHGRRRLRSSHSGCDDKAVAAATARQRTDLSGCSIRQLPASCQEHA